MEAVMEEISTCELKRGKPLPDTIHAAVQIKLAVELATRYRQQYRVLAGLALATSLVGAPPVLSGYPGFPTESDESSSL